MHNSSRETARNRGSVAVGPLTVPLVLVRFKMRLSLRYRLLVPLLLLLLGDIAATAWAAQSAARSADQKLAEQQWRIARTLTETASKYPLTEFVIEQVKGFSGAEFLLLQPGLPPLSTLPEKDISPPRDVPLATLSREGDEHRLGPPVIVAGQEYRCLRLPLKLRDPNAPGDLFIFYPESLRRTAMWDAARPPLVLGGIGGLIALGLAVAIGSRLVRRVRELEVRTRLIADGDFRPMPLPRTDDELKDLCHSVNDMARHLADLRDALQRAERLRVLGQFSGGLAHQLRNAVTGARLAVELFSTENPAADPEPVRVALRQLSRIESTLRQFLDLGKPPVGAKEPCELNALIDQAVQALKPQCHHAGTLLEWEAPAESIGITGDATQLSHLCNNIIGNAVDAAGASGVVRVQLATTAAGARITVTDTGPGPPAEIATKLFEPFVTGKEQGIGLGLAVAHQSALAHGGSIAWERHEGRTVFRVDFPI